MEDYANEPAGFVQLQSAVTAIAQQQGATTVQLIVEPTGGYELALVGFAYAAGWQVSLPNPRQVREWAKGVGKRAKTDRIDAQVLAHFGAGPRGHPQPKPQPPLASEVRELDNLLARRQDLEQMVRQEKKRLGELAALPGVPPAVLESLHEVITSLEKALETIETAMQSHLRHHLHLQRKVNRLLALPGIGPKTVLPLLVLLDRCGGPGIMRAGGGELEGTQGKINPTQRSGQLAPQDTVE